MAINTESVTLTDAAAVQLRDLFQKQANPNLALRVYVAPGGCSGFSYGMGFDDNLEASDLVFDHDGLKVVIDDMSINYLKGSEIDFVESLMGGGFTVHNPNAVKSCGCGHSFDAGDGGGNAQSCGSGCH
ncbi:MAG: iron-sulfur cluster insertion protein ErpA [Candidatus Dormibacteria bacterium]